MKLKLKKMKFQLKKTKFKSNKVNFSKIVHQKIKFLLFFNNRVLINQIQFKRKENRFFRKERVYNLMQNLRENK
jgi:hypothetical protein